MAAPRQRHCFRKAGRLQCKAALRAPACDAVDHTGKGDVLRFPAQREGYAVRMTFTPHETNSMKKKKKKGKTRREPGFDPGLEISCFSTV